LKISSAVAIPLPIVTRSEAINQRKINDFIVHFLTLKGISGWRNNAADEGEKADNLPLSCLMKT
jgi:hypothetical protein